MQENYLSMSVKRLFQILTTVLFSTVLNAQESTPVVHLWDKKDHHSANQIWSSTCDEQGIMYFGNASGMISYDAQQWRVYPIQGGGTVRSVFYDNGRIYAGSFEEFGYYQKLGNNEWEYVSLSDKITDYTMSNDEIWNIFRLENYIIFHSFMTLFIYNTENNKVTSFNTYEFNEYIGVDSEGRILSSAHGFSELDIDSGTCTALPHPWEGKMVAVIRRSDEGDLIVTRDEGLYLWRKKRLSRWTTNCKDNLSDALINRALITSNGELILGSSLYGAIAVDRNGQSLWKLDASNVLNGNTVLGICENKEGDIFLCLDSGIALVDNNNGIRYISNLDTSVGTVYCVQYKAPYLYIGSNQGLYVSRLDNTKLSISGIKQIKEVKGPVLYLRQIDSQIICGSNAETYSIEGDKILKLSKDNAGGACISKGIIHGQEVLVEGTYSQLCVYRKNNGRWVFSNKIDGFIQPVSTIDIDFMGNIWAGHNNRGLYRINVDSDIKTVTFQKYYPTLTKDRNKIRVKRIGGRTVFYDGEGYFTYNDVEDSITLYPALCEKFKSMKDVVNICENNSRELWLLNSDEATLIDPYSDNTPIEEISYNIFNSNSVDQLKEIKAGPGEYSIMTLNNALAFIPRGRANSKSTTFTPELKLDNVTISHNDGSHRKILDLDSPLKWNYTSRLVQFCYTYPNFNEIGNKQFQYKLEGRDDLYRNMIGEQLDLSHLSEGRYVLQVRVINNSGQMLARTSTEFRILPPFYKTPLAYVIYVLLSISFISLVGFSIKHKVKAEKKELENRRLEAELNAQSREIASTTMNLINKNKILTDLKEEIEVQKNAMGSLYPDKYYRRIISEIDSQISSEEDWLLFQKNFDRVHGDFFKILKSRYPSLTDSDLRFCSYLCMNLSSKEIASMMNISLKGVEAARYRIRKKLALPSNISLSSFLMDLK